MAFSIPRPMKPSRQLVIYNASHPSVIFGKIKTGAIRHWNQSKMVKSVNNWLKVPRKQISAEGQQSKPKKPSGLIVPQPGKSFLLIQTTDMMGDLLAENQRLRNMVDELVRETRT